MQIFLRWWLGLAFLTAGAAKVAGVRARPSAVPVPLAVLGSAEVAIGTFILVGFLAVPAAAGAMVLLALFTLHLARLLRRGQRRRCRCGGLLGDRLVTQALLLRNGVLLTGAALLLGSELLLAGDVSLDCALRGCLPALSPFAAKEAAAVLAGSGAGFLLAAVTTYAYWRHRPREVEEVDVDTVG